MPTDAGICVRDMHARWAPEPLRQQLRRKAHSSAAEPRTRVKRSCLIPMYHLRGLRRRLVEMTLLSKWKGMTPFGIMMRSSWQGRFATPSRIREPNSHASA